jgi:signal transduction histidine kinase
MLLTAHEVLAVHSKSSPGGERLFDPLESLPSVIEAFSAFGVKLSLTTEDTCGLVRGSADRFETLITCLLNNAIDHAEPGAEIELRARLRQANVVVEVRNPLAAVDRHQGYGMGTRIAVELARGLDAEVFSSSMDGSFCVTIRLPLATEAALAS